MHSQYRKQGKLTKLKRSSFPKEFIFFDVETHIKTVNEFTKELPLRFGVAIYVKLNKHGEITKRTQYVFHSTLEFIDILRQLVKKNRRILCFAHNVKFDIMALNLPFRLKALGYEFTYPIINGMMFIWRVKLNGGSVQFLDTANWVQMPLKKLGHEIGLEKLDADFENDSYAKLLEYNIRDVEIIEKFILEWVKFLYTNDLGEFKPTLASQSMTAYRHRFMTTQPEIHMHDDMLNLEREAYYGGRTEAFFIGDVPEDKIYYVDINSAYPYCMQNFRVPIEPMFYRNDCRMAMLEYHLKNNYVIAKVQLNTKQNAYPMRYNNKLMFPIGYPITTLHHDELLYAVEHNHIDRVLEYAVYKADVIFADYINFFYDKKIEATEQNHQLNRLMTKLLMNSLYGKFGQLNRVSKHIGSMDSMQCGTRAVIDHQTGKRFHEIIWYGEVYREETLGESTFSIPAIAGAITTYARMLLWDYMQTAGMENVYYCDTDSIITNETGYTRLAQHIHKTKLGALDLELESEDITIYGAKDYQIGTQRKTKGIPKHAEQISEGVWSFDYFIGFKEWRKAGGRGAPTIVTKTKRRKSAYDKGRVLASGHVAPLIIDGYEEIDYSELSDSLGSIGGEMS